MPAFAQPKNCQAAEAHHDGEKNVISNKDEHWDEVHIEDSSWPSSFYREAAPKIQY